MLKNLPLRLRLTFITAAIIIIIAILLTITSNLNASKVISAIPLQRSKVAGETYSIPMSDIINPNIIEPSLTVESAKVRFASHSIVYMIIVIIVGIAVTYITIGKFLEPVTELSNKVKNINENNLNEKIKEFNNKDELSELADSFNKMLERIERSFQNQKQFSSNAAHELRTPLANMQTNIEVFKKDKNPLKQDYEDIIDVFQRNTARLVDLVDDLFNLCNNAETDFNKKIDLTKMLLHIKKELECVSEKLSVSIYVEEGVKYLYGDEILLHRVFFNLIENAVKYNKPNGNITISSCEDKEKSVIIIKDTGIGIAKEEKEKIFEAFYRVDKSRSRKIGGSGVGLTLVASIIEKHNGTIEVDSNENGSTFKVILRKEER